VDDSPYNLFVLEELIRSITYQMNFVKLEIVKAYSGIEALEIAQKYIERDKTFFDLVFMDLNMPLMDGLKCTEEIKKLLRKSQVSCLTKFIAVSGLSLN